MLSFAGPEVGKKEFIYVCRPYTGERVPDSYGSDRMFYKGPVDPVDIEFYVMILLSVMNVVFG